VPLFTLSNAVTSRYTRNPPRRSCELALSSARSPPAGTKDCFYPSVSELETARLLLRRWRNEDLASYARICADPEVMRYLSGTMTRDQAAQQMEDRREWGADGSPSSVGELPRSMHSGE
jgi:RimJ/RimL family protein N-acetyltransferase